MYAAQLGDSQAAYEEALKKYKPFLELTQHIEVSRVEFSDCFDWIDSFRYNRVATYAKGFP